MTSIRSRAQWSARPPRHSSRGDLNQPSTGHYNGPDVKVKGSLRFDHKYCDGLVRGIQNFHMDGRGWSDIAYNFVICQHGVIYEGRGLNVRNGANGTNQANANSHAVMCLAGENNPFDVVEKAAFRHCVKHISDRTNAPYRAVGHRDHKATACPGQTRYDWIRGGMKLASAPAPAPTTPQPKDGFLMALSDKEQRDLVDKVNGIAFVVSGLFKILEGDNKNLGDTQQRQLASLKRIEQSLRGDLVGSIVAGVVAGVGEKKADEIDYEELTDAVEAGIRNVLLEGVAEE